MLKNTREIKENTPLWYNSNRGQNCKRFQDETEAVSCNSTVTMKLESERNKDTVRFRSQQ